MISWLRGKFMGTAGAKTILEVGGVGYGLWLPEKIKSELKLGEEITVYVHTFVREEVLDLYGFAKKEELDLFQLLLTVSGIGPKTALMVVDRGVEGVREAIVKADVSFFTIIPRIGKKNAQKIIIELKSKLGSLEEFDFEKSGETQAVINALQTMGYSRIEAMQAARQLPDDLVTVEEKVRYALRHMKI